MRISVYQKIINEIKETYYKQNFSNDGQRFVAWYLRNVHSRDMNQARDDVTDGSNDKQIDAVIVDDDKQTIFIIQGKFIGDGHVDGQPLREVLSSWIQIRDLVRLQESANQKLKRKLSEISQALEDEYEVVFELITTGSLTHAASTDLAAFQQDLAELSENEDFSASLNIIDQEEIKRRYDIALEKDNPSINHVVSLTDSKFLNFEISDNKVVIVALPLKECIAFPGIKDGTLFQKNVRQSLGLSNRVNKGIKHTIYSDKYKDFFFFHNGITAICNKLSIVDQSLKLRGLSIVNGCQSLSTILSCSEKVKNLEDAFVLFRFYEIPQRDRGDKISINTNSQSAVKPRDLRSNDKRVLGIKKTFEQKYPNGYFITKRGEPVPAEKDKIFVVDLVDMGKYLISWHSQRPNIAYSETKIFDKYFEQLFKKDYSPEKVQALNIWMQKVREQWDASNPLGLNESLLVMKSYAPYHHLYAISIAFSVVNNIPEGVPNPAIALEKANRAGIAEQIVKIAGICLNSALVAAVNEPQLGNRVFSPQNWIKTKKCLAGIRLALNQYFNMLPAMPGGEDLSQTLKQGMKIDTTEYEARWAAD